MRKDGLNNIPNKEGRQRSSNIVILRKDSTGIVNASPVHMNGKNVQYDLQRNPEWKRWKQTQKEENLSRAVSLPSVSSLSFVRTICILFTLGGIFLLIKHKK